MPEHARWTYLQNAPLVHRSRRPWLRQRVRPWAARLGEDAVEIDVRDLGYRWGSVRPTAGPLRISLRGRTLQLVLSLIDYILVHELAHLRETNRTPAFWSTVAGLMPTYEQHRATLATLGKTIRRGAEPVSPLQLGHHSDDGRHLRK